MRGFARASGVLLVAVVAVAPATARRARPVTEVHVTVQGSGVVTAPGINCRQSTKEHGQPRTNACTTQFVLPHKPMTFHATGAPVLMWDEDCPRHLLGQNDTCTIPLKIPKTRVTVVFTNPNVHPPSGSRPSVRPD